MEDKDIRRIALVQSAFLFEGFVTGEDLDNTGMGQIEAAHYLIPWAETIARVIAGMEGKQNFPGVFEYEVTEEFGAWLRGNLRERRATRVAKLFELVTEFFEQGKKLTLMERMLLAQLIDKGATE